MTPHAALKFLRDQLHVVFAGLVMTFVARYDVDKITKSKS